MTRNDASRLVVPCLLAAALGTAGHALAAEPTGPAEPQLVAEATAGERSIKVYAVDPVVTMPRELDAAILQEEHRYDDPRLGASFRYFDGIGINIDVYVYPLGDPQLADDDAAALDWIEEDFLAGMKQARKAGQYKKYKILQRDEIDLAQGELGGAAVFISGRVPPGDLRHLQLRTETADDRYLSEMICFSQDGLAIKLRRSQPEASMRPGMALSFAKALRESGFISMPQPSSADVEYTNRLLGLNGMIGASVRAQMQMSKDAKAGASSAPIAAPSTAPPP